MLARSALGRFRRLLGDSRFGPPLRRWRAAYEDREYSRALTHRQSAVLADVLYRLLTDLPAGPLEKADVRRRALSGATPAEIAGNIRNSPEGLKHAMNLFNPALRSYLRTQFDPATAQSVLPRVVFIHLMKAGGTSVADMLAHWFGPDRSRVGLYIDDVALCPPQVLANTRVVAGHIPFAALSLIPQPFKSVVVLRDPVSRALSHYANMRRSDPHFRDLTVEKFVFDTSLPWSGNFQARYLAHDIDLANAWRSWSPEQRLVLAGGDPDLRFPLQTLFENGEIGQTDEELLTNARRNLEQIDYVGTTDALDDLAARLASAFGFEAEKAPRLNTAPEPVDSIAMSAKVRRRLNERTAVDRELYLIAKDRARSS